MEITVNKSELSQDLLCLFENRRSAQQIWMLTLCKHYLRSTIRGFKAASSHHNRWIDNGSSRGRHRMEKCATIFRLSGQTTSMGRKNRTLLVVNKIKRNKNGKQKFSAYHCAS